MLKAPLKKMVCTQPYAVDYLGSNGPGGASYASIGIPSGLHTGWDLSCSTGTEVFAVMPGIIAFTDGGSGYGRDIRIRNKELGLEVVYAHLEGIVGANQRFVEAGEPIATSDNTGFSTGDHLHFGVRRIHWLASGAGPMVDDYDNGYFGYVDPTPFFPDDIFDLTVDKQYGLTPRTPGVPSELEWMKTNVWVWKNLKRLLTTREMKALRYGFWDLRTVLDPAFFPVWSQMHKPAAQKLNLVK